jgi:hypothetical protein
MEALFLLPVLVLIVARVGDRISRRIGGWEGI